MADATPVELSVFAGLESTVGEMALVRRGGRLGATARGVGSPLLGAGVWVAGYPVLGDLDRTATAQELFDKGVGLEASRVVARGEGMVELSPLRTSNGRAATALRGTLGFGAIYSIDDDSVVEPLHPHEISPAWSWGLIVDTWRLQRPLRGAGVQLHCSQSFHRETFDEHRSWKEPFWIGVDLGFSWRRPDRDKP